MQLKKKDTSILEQFRCPTGLHGRTVAASMNKSHSALSKWGLNKINLGSRFVILDVGCGGGKNLTRMVRLAFQGKVFGMDYSATMVKYSREKNKRLITQNRLEIIQGSVEKICFQENFFDLVTAIETYYFWPNLLDAFREINRVLKPTRNLVIINEMIKNGIYEVDNAEIIKKTHVHLLTLDKLKCILQSAGFVNVQTFTKINSPWNAILAQKP
ncbi:class I SAM-dependent methyltransferase [Candidatus Bathyarchaeota archaeon]|nr:class I SAM-dependent methyltransferase [Candidatus Bathyarchaeota archaeon]